MKTIVIHSHKGGVGKTTVALALAKYRTMENEKVCVLDCDFLGSGMADLYRYKPAPKMYLDRFLFAANPHDYPLDDLVGEYTDPDLTSSFSVMLSQWLPDAEAKWRKQRARLDRHMGDEPTFGSSKDALLILLERLEARYDVVIIDCHPGLGFISASIRELADLNVYVVTPHRGDIFGLLKQVNLDKRGFDNSKSFLLVNRCESAMLDLPTFQQLLRSDWIHGASVRTILGALKHLAINPEGFAAIPEWDEYRLAYNPGPESHFPRVVSTSEPFAFCPKVFHCL